VSITTCLPVNPIDQPKAASRLWESQDAERVNGLSVTEVRRTSQRGEDPHGFFS
jgi:hypothetical protein